MSIKITGIDTPFGGISWEYSKSEKEGIQEAFYFLESKRILVNPIEMERKCWCEQSTIEIKNKLVEILSKYKFSENTVICFKNMIIACNSFLDNLNGVENNTIIYKNSQCDWEDVLFSSSMKKLRNIFRENILNLSDNFHIQFNKIIPENY